MMCWICSFIRKHEKFEHSRSRRGWLYLPTQKLPEPRGLPLRVALSCARLPLIFAIEALPQMMKQAFPILTSDGLWAFELHEENPPRFRVRDEPRLRSAWRSRICFLEHVPLRFLDFERGKAEFLFAGGALLCSSTGGERLGWSLRSSETGSRRSSWLRNWLQNRMESLLLGHWLSRCLHRWLHRWLYLRR